MKKWNAEWYWDYKSKAENEEKKMIEDRLDTLGKMSSPDRQKSIRASLLNDGTHDYDHWTNALSMIEKHGHLYAGGLQDLEGSWIYFRRIAGIPLDADISQYSEFQEAVKGVRGSILDGNVTEEAVIQEYMKKNVHFPNSQIWRMVKKRIQSGNDEELKNGGIEVEQFSTLDQRVNYALSKIESREYAHAIGAMEPIFDKDGPAHKKQSLAFMFAMSRIPERLPPSLLSKFTDIYNKGRLHSPALVFIKDLSSQAIFRDTVKAIVEEKVSRLQADPATQAEGNALKNDFDQMMGAISKNGDMKPIFASMKKFWESYGPEIQKELTAAPESSILSSSTARNENPALGRYHSKLKSQIGDANIANDGEIDRGTPFAAGETGASVIFLRPDKVIDKMGLNLSSNSFAQTGLEKAFQEDFVDALKLIRDKGVEELSEEDKRALFESVYTAFTAKIQSVSDISRFLRHETVKPFIEMGLEPPKEATRAQVEERTREIAERLAPKKKDLREKNRQIKQLSDANQQVPDGLELESVLLSQEVRQLEAEMKAEQNKLQRFGKYNPLDDAHQAHFEAMYARFTGSGTSVAQTVNHARNGAAAVMNPARQP